MKSLLVFERRDAIVTLGLGKRLTRGVAETIKGAYSLEKDYLHRYRMEFIKEGVATVLNRTGVFEAIVDSKYSCNTNLYANEMLEALGKYCKANDMAHNLITCTDKVPASEGTDVPYPKVEFLTVP